MGACACLPCGPWRPWAAQETAPEPQEPAPEPEPPWAAALGARVAQLEGRATALGGWAARAIALGNRVDRLEAQPRWQVRAAQFAEELRLHDVRLIHNEDCVEELFERADHLSDLLDRLAQRVTDIELPDPA